jgi:hypothetical protein
MVGRGVGGIFFGFVLFAYALHLNGGAAQSTDSAAATDRGASRPETKRKCCMKQEVLRFA